MYTVTDIVESRSPIANTVISVVELDHGDCYACCWESHMADLPFRLAVGSVIPAREQDGGEAGWRVFATKKEAMDESKVICNTLDV